MAHFINVEIKGFRLPWNGENFKLRQFWTTEILRGRKYVSQAYTLGKTGMKLIWGSYRPQQREAMLGHE